MTMILFDFVTNEIIEFDNKQETQIINNKHQLYKDKINLVFGRDYLCGVYVWFIKAIDDDTITRLSLEQKVSQYLRNK